jgi:hypothetical protein
MEISSSDRLAYWYLRFNGFLLLENFIVHPDHGARQRTDVDLLGVRFRHRQELLDDPMQDDPTVSECDTPCNLVIVEVKRGRCSLNGPWTDPLKENMQRVLHALGCLKPKTVNKAAEAIYTNGWYRDGVATVRLFAFGNEKGDLSIPTVPQVLFQDMLRFIHTRFRTYLTQKSSGGSWPADGRRLQNFAERFGEFSEFERAARHYFNLAAARPTAQRNEAAYGG